MTGLKVLIGTILFVVVANMLIGLIAVMPTERARKILIFSSVFVSFCFLGFFKYFNFFVESAEGLFQTMNIDPANLRLGIVLPVGISFYTFQSLSYTIDIYRGQFKPTERFFDFALFVAYFPQLQAGPIERARQLLPQLSRPRHPSLTRRAVSI